MPDTELLVPLAEIAGVFVGFGALIAVRSSGPTEAADVAPVRTVVVLGMGTVIGALVPGALARLDLAEHAVWALSSAVCLVGGLVFGAAMARTPEWRASWASTIEETRVRSRPRWLELIYWAFYGLYMLALMITPIVIMLGVVPDLEAALYYAYIVLILLAAGWTLLELVLAQRLPAKATSV